MSMPICQRLVSDLQQSEMMRVNPRSGFLELRTRRWDDSRDTMEKFGEPIPLFRELRSTEWLIQAIDQQTVGVYKQTDPLPQEEDEVVLDLLSAVLLHNSFVRSHGRRDLGIWVWDETKEVLTRQTLV